MAPLHIGDFRSAGINIFCKFKQQPNPSSMKLLFFSIAALSLVNGSAQENSDQTRLENDTLFTKSGFKFYEGQNVKLGTGTLPSGDFKFVRISATSLWQATGNNREAVNNYNSMTKSASGLSFKVVRIDKRGNKKMGWVYYPIIQYRVGKYEIDPDNAIGAGEIDVPEEFKPKSKVAVVQVNQKLSVADELTKLKKLLDDGVITKEEFEAQKKKLLDQ